MTHTLFDLLENTGLLKGDKVNRDAVSSTKQSELLDIATQAGDLTSAASIGTANSIYTHTASLSLSGGPWPCSGMKCRLSKAHELAQFAAFYSERVFINNGLASLARGSKNSPTSNIQRGFLRELEIIAVLRPLIEAGIIVPVATPPRLCFHCLGKSALSEEDRSKFDRSLKKLSRRFANETEITLEYDSDKRLQLHITGNEELVEHGSMWRNRKDLAKQVAENKGLLKKLTANGVAKLPRSLRERLEVDKEFAHIWFSNIGFEMGVSQCLKTSVVTSKPLEVDILSDFFSSSSINRRNALIQRHLTCMVPFLDAITPTELLAMRNGEADAFISFRHTFAKAIDEHLKSKAGQITEADAKAIFHDVIEPELARMNRKVVSASKSILRKSGAGLMGWAAAISAGLYFGVVESSLISAARALGLTKVAADLATGLMASSGEEAIRNENMYFLWKVRHRAGQD
ncbi:MAG: hypothetical protein AAB448_00180 [Patescibacteria group bacterium]